MPKITNIKINKFQNPTNALIALVTVTLDDCFVINDIKIIKSLKEEKVFLAMPNKKLSNGLFKDICHPITSEFRQEITKAVLDKFYEE